MLKLKASFGQQGNDDLLLPAGNISVISIWRRTSILGWTSTR